MENTLLNIEDILSFIGNDNETVKEVRSSMRIQKSLKNIDKIKGDFYCLTANDILKAVYGDNIKYPIDVNYIANFFGIELFAKSINNFDGVSYFDDKSNKCFIFYKDNNKFKSRFTIAHELGHIFLHFLSGRVTKNRIEDKEININIDSSLLVARTYIGYSENNIELEANIFAENLLVLKN